MNGAFQLISNCTGCTATCGNTVEAAGLELGRLAQLARGGPGPGTPDSSAVQLTGRPGEPRRSGRTRRCDSPRPTVACITAARQLAAAREAMATISSEVGQAGRDGLAVVADVGRRLRRGEPERAGLEGLAHERASARRPPRAWPRARRRPRPSRTAAARCGRSARRRSSRSPGPRRASRYSGNVSNGHSVAEAGPERGDAHALDVLERAHDEVAVGRPGRRHREAAVAHDHGGHAVPGRAAHQLVPHDLGVVVGVDVDEARADDPAGGVDGARRVLRGRRRGRRPCRP